MKKTGKIISLCLAGSLMLSITPTQTNCGVLGRFLKSRHGLKAIGLTCIMGTIFTSFYNKDQSKDQNITLGPKAHLPFYLSCLGSTAGWLSIKDEEDRLGAIFPMTALLLGKERIKTIANRFEETKKRLWSGFKQTRIGKFFENEINTVENLFANDDNGDNDNSDGDDDSDNSDSEEDEDKDTINTSPAQTKYGVLGRFLKSRQCLKVIGLTCVIGAIFTSFYNKDQNITFGRKTYLPFYLSCFGSIASWLSVKNEGDRIGVILPITGLLIGKRRTKNIINRFKAIEKRIWNGFKAYTYGKFFQKQNKHSGKVS